MSSVDDGKRVFNIEIEALRKTRDALGDNFAHILKLITMCRGKVFLSGMGKAGHIASKIAATFASLGTPAVFFHPSEALHGDLGMVSKNDLVILISFSGESDEIVGLLFGLKGLGATLVGITGNTSSTLAGWLIMWKYYQTYRRRATLDWRQLPVQLPCFVMEMPLLLLPAKSVDLIKLILQSSTRLVL